MAWNRKPCAIHRIIECEECPRPRVFCGSLCDWLDPDVPLQWFIDLMKLIEATPYLDWLLLSKRIGLLSSRLQAAQKDAGAAQSAHGWLLRRQNVWIGTSIEDQATVDSRIPALLNTTARIRFLSCEPLLDQVDLRIGAFNGLDSFSKIAGIHWVIAGGESGPGCRPMNVEWARSLRDQCAVAGVPFWMKQLGGYPDKRHELCDLPEDLRIRELPQSSR